MIMALTQAVSQDMLLKSEAPVLSAHTHILAAAEWLKHAQDMTRNDGVGYGYYLRGNPLKAHGLGWRPSYVETSGYIIETFFDLAEIIEDPDFAQRAERIAHWLMSVQHEDGSFGNNQMSGQAGLIFDTGQVLFGLSRAFRETQRPEFQNSARRAAEWLVETQSDDGGWYQHTHLGHPHSYNARTAWAMLDYAATAKTEDDAVKAAARQNLDWVTRQQNAHGLFEHSGFQPNTAPFTHTIAYTIRGLYEGGRLLNEGRFTVAAYEAALAVARHIRGDGFLPGRISKTGKPDHSFTCLTGNCQMAVLWMKLGLYFNNREIIEQASAVLDYTLQFQAMKSALKNTYGALPGSHPIWGAYTPLAYPNWATKFLLDALMLRERINAE